MKRLRELLEYTEDVGMPEDTIGSLKRSIRKGAQDISREWDSALELVNYAYSVGLGKDEVDEDGDKKQPLTPPTPDMKTSWKQYEDLITFAVQSLSKARGIKGEWRVTTPTLEMLNIYDYHTNPESFKNREKVLDSVPDFFWEKYKNNPEELKKREGAIAKSAKYSYLYALDVLKTRFELGEEAIATNAPYSYLYALYVLRNRFEAGEKIIATDAWCSYRYAADVLKERFEAGEKAIATDAHYSFLYARNVLKGRFEAGETVILNSGYKHAYLDFLKEKGIEI